jgi:ubiquinone/menaquinone biosynthesis C-methylase UbiE/catechol 2,3-dioxygenase-like lactoylglutathione lyase family enzyme
MNDTTQTEITGIDHVQVAIPRGGEEAGRAFYGGVLGLREIAKPPTLAGRGGVWFACGKQQVHLAVESAFAPQRKGHPALLVADLAALRARLAAAGAAIVEDELLPVYERIYTLDPFGNRLELLRPLRPGEATAADAANHSEADEVKQRVREAFGRTAEAYVASKTHAEGTDLAILLDWAAPQPTDRALDVSTGGGHTALALAPRVARIIASDLTPRMLAVARDHLTRQGVANADYVIADAERLPFLDASFELVTVRIAPHHYADAARAVREMARVLTQGGRLALIDNIAPEDPLLDRYVNAWEKRRDPSHVRAYTASQWGAFLEAAGLRIERMQTQRKVHPFADWVERMQVAAAERAGLEADMLSAPPAVREYFEVIASDGRVVSWSADYLIALATKAS